MLPDVVNRSEMLRAARAQAILRRWEEFVGPALAAKSLPDKFERGTIWVAVDGSAWAQELRMMSETILQRLNKEAGEKLFEGVRFGVRARRGLHGEEPQAPTPVCDLEYEGMSIREIAERRLRLLEDASRAQQ